MRAAGNALSMISGVDASKVSRFLVGIRDGCTMLGISISHPTPPQSSAQASLLPPSKLAIAVEQAYHGLACSSATCMYLQARPNTCAAATAEEKDHH